MDHFAKTHTDTEAHTCTHAHTGWVHITLSGLPFLYTRLTYPSSSTFSPSAPITPEARPDSLHGDLLEEVGHSSVLLPLLFNPPPSRMIHCPVPILWIKAEAHFSIDAKLPGSTDASILFTPARHPALQGQRVWPYQGNERAQVLRAEFRQILCLTVIHLPWAQVIRPCSLLQGPLLPLDY